jgi:tetratricopeptide (TPR) repeat protein
MKFHLKILIQTVALQWPSETSLKLLFPFSLVHQGSTAFLLLLTTASLFSAQQPASVQQAAEDYRQGVAAFSRNDLQTARQHFQNVVRLAPETEPGHLMLGFVLAKLGRTTEAIPELEKALALNPNDNDARMNLALAYEQTNSPAKAIPHFVKLDEAMRAQGHALPPPALAAYIRALDATKQWSEANSKMLAAVAADPQNADLHDQCGSLYLQQHDWTKAQQQFAEAIRLKPDFATAHLHLGLALRAAGQMGAGAEFQKAYDLAPQNPAFIAEVASALIATGQSEQAIPILQRALEMSPKSPALMYQLGLAYQDNGKAQDAIPLFRKVVTAEPRNTPALTNLGLALCQVQRARDAVPVLQKAISIAPRDLTARQNLAAAYVNLGQYDDAIATLRAALKLAPNDPRLHYNLGVAFKMQDDAAKAIPELKAAEKLDPTQPEAPYVLGMLYSQTGHMEEAEEALNASLKLRPENGEGWSTLGTVYNTLGKYPEAASALREAIKQLPDQANPHLTLATVLASDNKQAEAAAERKLAADLLRAHMNLQRAEVATNAGQSLLKGGNIPEAIVQFKDALSYNPNYVEAHLGLAAALERQGNVVDAAAERQKANDLKKLPASH